MLDCIYRMIPTCQERAGFDDQVFLIVAFLGMNEKLSSDRRIAYCYRSFFLFWCGPVS